MIKKEIYSKTQRLKINGDKNDTREKINYKRNI